MRNHPGAFRGFFSTLAAATFLALTLSSCAVTVALPGGGSTTTPIKPPTNIGTGTGGGASGGGTTETKPEPSEPAPEEPKPEEPKDDKPVEKPKEESKEKPKEEPKEDPNESETKPVGKPTLPQPGDNMNVPNGYEATWILEGTTLVLRTYTIPRGSDVNVELPTGGNYKIGDSAFAGKNRIASIKIPEDVIEIGNNAFTGTFLTAVEIPESVKVIGDYAFAQTRLQNVTLKGNYAPGQLGKYSFSSCDLLENVTFTGTAAELPEGIFSYTSLSSFTLPKNLKAIHAKVFDYTDTLSDLYIPCSVMEVDLSAFDNTWVTIHYAGTSEEWAAIAKGTLPEGVILDCPSKAPAEDSFSLLTALSSLL